MWQTRENGTYQVRANSGRLIVRSYNLETAECFALAGKSRDIWKWDGKKYRHYRAYGA